MITENEAKKSLSVLNIIWGAIFVSLIAYLLIGHFVISGMPAGLDAETYKTTKYVFYGLAVVCLLSSRTAKIFVLSSKGKSGSISVTDANPAVQKYTAAMIINWALLEAVGIFGFVLFILGRNPNDLFILIFVSAVSMLMNRPKKEELINLSKNISAGNTGIGKE